MPPRSPYRWALPAAALACGVALGAAAQKGGDMGFPYGDLKEVTLRGRMVDLGPELTRKYGARTTGAGPEKQWALALPEGELYTFLDNEHSRKLTQGSAAGRAVEVKARLFPRSHLLEVVAFRETDAAPLKRRFHCGICNITTEDWGPCACCGREMEPVREK